MRNREIYTYTDLQKLEKCYFWQELRKYPQICVSSDMRKALKGTKEYDGKDGLFYRDRDVRVCEFRRLYEAVFPKWTDDETKFHETVILAQFIREQIAQRGNNPSIRNWLVGCRRNLGLLLSGIILLEEAAIAPEELDATGDRNIQFMIEAWKYLKKKSPSISNFNKRFEQLSLKSSWTPIFNRIFGYTDIHTLVIHGFYYFTSLQERLLCALEKAGIRLVFLFHYNEKYPYVNEIWRKTYSIENGYPLMERWHIETSNEPDSFGEIFQGRKYEITNQLQVCEYTSVMEFVNEIKQVKEQGYSIYSSNHIAANDMIKDFYPESYGERKLLSYPIGQFISTLNRMWDEELQTVVMEEEQLIECFMSGWLAVDGEAGKQYMEDLIRILPFFKDCRESWKWKERLAFLMQIRENVLEPFKRNLDFNEKIARWQEVLGNPFLNFSVFSVTDENMDVIEKLMKRLLEMAENLFGKGKPIRIQEHIRKLELILKSHEMSDELYEEEKNIVRDLFEKLGENSHFQTECFPSDISDALSLYMNGYLNNEEIQSDKECLVSPLYQVAAKSIGTDGKVHICYCDTETLPRRKKEYVWPLTGRHIKECYRRTGNTLIRNIIHIMENSDICDRYFIYMALKNKDVQLSWISNIGEKIKAPSPYIKLICEAAKIDIISKKKQEITLRHVYEKQSYNPRILDYCVEKMPVRTIKEAKMDYSICPMKYVLGYVVEKFPVFQNEFHQNYAVNGLITSIYSLMKKQDMSIDEIYDEIICLFPAMRKIEKRQVYDYLQFQNSFTDEDIEERTELQEIQYTDLRLKVRFPNKDVRQLALDRYAYFMTPDGQKGMDLYKTATGITEDSGKMDKANACLFCQHQSYCRYAVFQADQELLYD